MNDRHPPHRRRRSVDIDGLRRDADHIGKIQKVIITGVFGAGKSQAAALGRRSAGFGEILVEIFMRVMEGVGQMDEEPGADDRRRREPHMEALHRPRQILDDGEVRNNCCDRRDRSKAGEHENKKSSLVAHSGPPPHRLRSRPGDHDAGSNEIKPGPRVPGDQKSCRQAN